jgi:hypothetical protein
MVVFTSFIKVEPKIKSGYFAQLFLKVAFLKVAFLKVA